MYVRAHIRNSFLIKKFIFSYLYKCLPYICSVERVEILKAFLYRNRYKFFDILNDSLSASNKTLIDLNASIKIHPLNVKRY